MTDIDLLVVDPAHAVPANEAILDFGYRMVRPDEVDSDAIDHDDHQEPALLRDDRHGSVEIHSHLLPRFARHALTREAAVRGISAEAKGSRLAIADVTLHVIAHARLADRALIRADLSLNSVFDVGYLLASEPALAVTLSRRQLPRDVRRAVNVHWAAVESIFGVSTGASTTSARCGGDGRCGWPIAHVCTRSTATWSWCRSFSTVIGFPSGTGATYTDGTWRAHACLTSSVVRGLLSKMPGEQHESPDHRWSGLHRKHRGVEVRRRRDRCRDPRQPADRPCRIRPSIPVLLRRHCGRETTRQDIHRPSRYRCHSSLCCPDRGRRFRQ